MSQDDPQKPSEELTPNTSNLGYEIVFNKTTNEILLKDSKGNAASLKATIIEQENDGEEDDDVPLTPEQFGAALRRVDELGLTWSADRVPRAKVKENIGEDVLLGDEFRKIQEEYPTLPLELGVAVSYALTGNKLLAFEVGGDEVLKEKAKIVTDIVLSVDYRSEFFFKHALKVPYFSNIDWEVILKLREKNVKHSPGVSYALLTLLFHDENAEKNKHQSLTVAVDTILVNKLIASLTQVKKGLEQGRRLSEVIHRKAEKEDKANDDSTLGQEHMG